MNLKLRQKMKVSKLLKNHKSFRSYKSKDIPKEILDDILLCGQRASTAGNMQSWCAVLTKDQERKQQLFELHSKQQMILQAPVIITFCSDFNRMKQWLSANNSKQSFDDTPCSKLCCF